MSSTSPQGGPRDATGKIYVGSGHMRMNISNQGHDIAMITDFGSKTVDVLMVPQKMYIEHKAGQAQGRGPGSNFSQDLHPYDPENPCANQPDITCKKIGVETVNGRTCDHWEITDKRGRSTTSGWTRSCTSRLKLLLRIRPSCSAMWKKANPTPASFRFRKTSARWT